MTERFKCIKPIQNRKQIQIFKEFLRCEYSNVNQIQMKINVIKTMSAVLIYFGLDIRAHLITFTLPLCITNFDIKICRYIFIILLDFIFYNIKTIKI